MRLRADSFLTAVFAISACVTAVFPDWIEVVLHVDPDHGAGIVEWEVTTALGSAALAVGSLTWRMIASIARRVETVPLQWQPTNTWGILVDEHSDAWHAGHLNDALPLTDDSVLAGTDSGGAWLCTPDDASALGDDWDDPNVAALASGPDGPWHVLCATDQTLRESRTWGRLSLTTVPGRLGKSMKSRARSVPDDCSSHRARAYFIHRFRPRELPITTSGMRSLYLPTRDQLSRLSPYGRAAALGNRTTLARFVGPASTSTTRRRCSG